MVPIWGTGCVCRSRQIRLSIIVMIVMLFLDEIFSRRTMFRFYVVLVEGFWGLYTSRCTDVDLFESTILLLFRVSRHLEKSFFQSPLNHLFRKETVSDPRCAALFSSTFTPWKFNIAPENIPSQKESSLPTIFFRGYVKLRGVGVLIVQSIEGSQGVAWCLVMDIRAVLDGWVRQGKENIDGSYDKGAPNVVGNCHRQFLLKWLKCIRTCILG